MPDPITWLAHYNDGEQFAQNDHTYADIDRGRLQAFDLRQGGKLLVRVDLRPDDGDGEIEPRRLVWRVRNILDTGGKQTRIHLVGWQRRVNGRNVQAICYVFEDGTVLLGGQFTGQDFMDEIVPFEWEADLR